MVRMARVQLSSYGDALLGDCVRAQEMDRDLCLGHQFHEI